MTRATAASRNAAPRPWRTPLRKLLRSTFGLQQLRAGQEAAIDSVMARRPTLAVMPTGAGKSLCYQLPALLLPGATLVVSPLIALMKDQCDKLRELGIEAVQLNSAVPADDIAAAEASIEAGQAKIVFTTPERLADNGFLGKLAAQRTSLLVVDEAHCISQWGHDFRPAFLEIGGAVEHLSRPTILALTATASDAVIEDIAHQLGVDRFNVINTGMYRPNLHYRVQQVTNEDEKLARAVAIVTASEGPGLVYAATVKGAESVHAALAQAGIRASLYHGRLGASARREQQDAFMDGDTSVMVATNAFGLGIDKADVRFVLHYQMPGGLDAYYQESGRAGRDGEVADCTLLFLRSDKAVQQFFLAGKYPAREDVADLYGALQQGREGDDAGGPWTLAALQQTLDRPRAKLQVALRLLRHQGVVRQDREGRLALTREGLDADALEKLLATYREKREHDRLMLERMVFYGQTGHCRWKVLLENFDDAERLSSCGTCDNCARIAAAFAAAEAAMHEPATPAPEHVDEPAFARGEPVVVPRYGRGLVDGADAEGVTVVFPGGERRMFLPSFVRRDPRPRRGQQKLPQAVPAPS